MIQHYELLVLYPGTQTEEEAQQKSAAIDALVKQQGSSVTLHEFWGKRKLAYEIEHIHHGYYDLFEFDLESTSLQALDTVLRLSDMVLRHQITRKEVKSPERLAAEAALRERIATKREAAREQEQGKQMAGAPVEPMAAPVEVAPLEAKQLDQKLEEMLESDKVDV